MMPTRADVLIIAVTKVEARAVLDAFKVVTGRAARTESINSRVYRHLGEVSGARVLLGMSGMGAAGLGGSLQEIARSIESLHPAAVIMAGVAFGVDEEKQSIGDVLVSQHLRLYDLQRVGSSDVIPRGARPDASAWLLDYLKSADLEWDEARAKIRFGLVLTGDKLVDNKDYRDGLIRFEPEAIGGEMEGAGLYAACHAAKVDWILVKAICDWADGNKAAGKKERQELAAANAAAFVLHALQHAPLGQFPRPDGDKTPANSNSDSGGLATHGSVASGQDGRAAGRDFFETHVHRSTEPQLPDVYSSLPSQPFFFGREAELNVVAAAIAPEVRSWGVLVDGPGGIGKTALAVRAGHLAPEEHFPLKLFLSAKRRELTPSGPDELTDFALREYDDLLKELGHELKEEGLEKLPPGERANAVRRVLGDKRALLVIDNVESFSEGECKRLYQFLERLPLGCKAIVTSRRRTDIDARVVRLTRMQEGEALEMIAALATTRPLLEKATDEERHQLYEVSNGNPLVLRWLVGQLGREGSQCRTVQQACEFFGSAPGDNDPLEFIFGDLLGTFTPNEIAVLTALTHFAHPAQVKWISATARLPHSTTQTSLEDLAMRALLESDDAQEAFYLPPLTAGFLRRARPDMIVETGGRLAWITYIQAMSYANASDTDFALLEAEWPQIQAALPLLMRGDNTRLQLACPGLTRFMMYFNHWDECLALQEEAEERALAEDDYVNAYLRAYTAGRIHYQYGHTALVQACARRCVGYRLDADGDVKDNSLELRLQIMSFELQGNHGAACAVAEEHLALVQASDPNSASALDAHYNVAVMKHLCKDYDGAEREYQKCYRLAARLKNKAGRAASIGGLAELAIDREEWADAEALGRKGLNESQSLGHQVLIARNSLRLATALMRQGNADEAADYARRSVDIYIRLRHRHLEKAQAVLRGCLEQDEHPLGQQKCQLQA